VPSSAGQPSLQPPLSVAYDKLIIATGSNPIIIPVPGHDMPGVLSYRDLDDVQAMLLAATSRGSAVNHRRRPARPGGRGRPAGAGNGRHRRAPDADAHGTPAPIPPPAISCNAPSKRVASSDHPGHTKASSVRAGWKPSSWTTARGWRLPWL